MYINYDPMMTLIYFTARSAYVAHAFKMSLKGKTFRKWANGHTIYNSENKIDPRCSSVPDLGTSDPL